MGGEDKMAAAGNIARDIEETQAAPAATGAPNASDVRSVSLLFEESAAGRSGADVKARAAIETDAVALLGADLCLDDTPGFLHTRELSLLLVFIPLPPSPSPSP